MEDVLIFNLEKCVHRQITATLAAFAAVTGSSKPATDTYPITSRALHFAGLPQQPPAGSQDDPLRALAAKAELPPTHLSDE